MQWHGFGRRSESWQNVVDLSRLYLTTLTRLSSAPVEQLDPLPTPSLTVPFRRDVDFVNRVTLQGRGTMLEQIEQHCAVPASRVALVGIGGAG
jgi:hypothetical protein